MTSEVILYQTKKMGLHIVSIHINLYQNQFINECARKKKAKFPDLRKDGVFLRVIKELTFLIDMLQTLKTLYFSISVSNIVYMKFNTAITFKDLSAYSKNIS